MLFAGGLLLAGALSIAAAGPGTLPGDLRFALWLQGQTPAGAQTLIDFVNMIGAARSLLPVATLLASGAMLAGWTRRALMLVGAMLAQAFNPLLKVIAESPRPGADQVDATSHATGFGFPSGHAMGSMALAMVLALMLPGSLPNHPGVARTLQAALLAFAFIVGLARIVSGVHWPSDVLGGWLWGALIGAGAIVVCERVQLRRQPRPRQ